MRPSPAGARSRNGDLTSIVINNFNYARFLPDAVDSALNQTHSPTEVVVVDDGSSDASRKVIASYGDRIRPILTPNRGQAAAINVGIAQSRGRYVCLLDSDDSFMPEKVAACISALKTVGECEDRTLVVHPLEVVSEHGEPTGAIEPGRARRQHPANLYRYAVRYGYLPYAGPPTSGLTLTRVFAERIFPIPTHHTRTCADGPIVRAASLIGEVKWLPTPLGTYRIHGANHFQGGSRIRSREQILVEQEFLNEKLRENGREPVLAFFESMFARELLEKCGDRRGLARLALAAVRRHPDPHTLSFCARTLATAMMRTGAVGNRHSGRREGGAY